MLCGVEMHPVVSTFQTGPVFSYFITAKNIESRQNWRGNDNVWEADLFNLRPADLWSMDMALL